MMTDTFCVFMTHTLEKEREYSAGAAASMPYEVRDCIVIPRSYDEESAMFRDDIQKLCQANQQIKDALDNGKPASVEYTLKEILDIVPRERRRADAYQRLQRYLLTKGINLVIHSQKTKYASNI